MVRVAAVQTCSSDDVDQNLDDLAGYVEIAKEGGAEVVVVPECFALMQSSRRQLRDLAEVFGHGKIQQFVGQCARKHGLWIVAGSIPLQSADPNRVFNSQLVYDDFGKSVVRYDKIHLFNVELANGEQYRESDYTMAGENCVVQQTPIGPVGLSVCYDLRFPEMYRALSRMGATSIVVPSAFTVSTGKAHWKPLLRARAIENGCYVIAPAQTGIHASGRETYGHSLIIDPWGDVIAHKKSKTGVLFADIDTEKIEQVRNQLPVQSHRRPDLFS